MAASSFFEGEGQIFSFRHGQHGSTILTSHKVLPPIKNTEAIKLRSMEGVIKFYFHPLPLFRKNALVASIFNFLLSLGTVFAVFLPPKISTARKNF